MENEDRYTPSMVARLLRQFPQQIDGSALGYCGQRAQTGQNKPIVRIVRCSRFLLDPNNVDGANKIILDRLVEAGLIPGDEEEDIWLDASHQIQVGTKKEEGTSITISYPLPVTGDTIDAMSAESQQPAPSGPLPMDDIRPMSPTENYPSDGPLSKERQAAQTIKKSIMDKKLNQMNLHKQKVGGPPADKRL